MYCMKCKQKTESRNVEETISKNNKRLLKGFCAICGKKKSSFIARRAKAGKGLGNNIVKAMGELHLPATNGEYVPNGSFNNINKYSYCGPGTKYDQRNKEGYQGINELDKMCKLHDQFYNENEDTSTRNISDRALAHRANEIANDPAYDSRQRSDAWFVNMIMKNKAKFGLGARGRTGDISKNFKKGSTK